MKKVIVDIDGTISKLGDRLKYLNQDPPDWDNFYENCMEDEPIWEIIYLVGSLMNSGYHIVFCTGRRESVRNKTNMWLHQYFGQYFAPLDLLMRRDGDHRHDTEVKPELMSNACIAPDDVHFVLEDRASMVKKWRELGYRCLQVAEGDF